MNQVSALLARYEDFTATRRNHCEFGFDPTEAKLAVQIMDDLAAALRASPEAHADKALTEDQATIHVTKAEQEAIDLWVATCNCGWREEFTAPNPNRPSLAERYAVAAAGCHAEYEEARIARREDLAAIVLCNLLPEGSPSRDAMHSTRLSGIPLATLANLVVEKLSARVSEDQGSKSEAPTVDQLMEMVEGLGAVAPVPWSRAEREAWAERSAALRTALESALGVRGEEPATATPVEMGKQTGRAASCEAPCDAVESPSPSSPAPLGESALRAPEPSPQEPSDKAIYQSMAKEWGIDAADQAYSMWRNARDEVRGQALEGTQDKTLSEVVVRLRNIVLEAKHLRTGSWNEAGSWCVKQIIEEAEASLALLRGGASASPPMCECGHTLERHSATGSLCFAEGCECDCQGFTSNPQSAGSPEGSEAP